MKQSNNRKNTGSSEIHGALKEGLFFIKNDSNSSPFGARSLEEALSEVRNFEGALSIACIVASYFGLNTPLPSSR